MGRIRTAGMMFGVLIFALVGPGPLAPRAIRAEVPLQGPVPEDGLPLQLSLSESTVERVAFEVDVTAPILGLMTLDGAEYATVSIPGWGQMDEAGHPQLPTYRLLVGVPAVGEVRLTVDAGTPQRWATARVAPAPRLRIADPGFDPQAGVESATEVSRSYEAVAAVYSAETAYPGRVARVAEVGFFRGQRVAAVDLFPVQYVPAAGELLFHSHVSLELTIEGAPATTDEASRDNGVFAPILREGLINYDTASAWAVAGGQVAAPLVDGWPLATDAYKILFYESGVYRLTYTELRDAGLPVDTLDPRTLQIYWQGSEIPIQVLGEADGRLDPTDVVLFYGEITENKYVAEGVCWLTYGQTTGQRMTERPAAPTGVGQSHFWDRMTISQNSRYSSNWPGDDDVERWYWVYVYTLPQNVDATVDLPFLASEVVSATVTAEMWGSSSFPEYDLDHHAQVYVNDILVGEHWWDGDADVQTLSFEFPQSYLSSTISNTLRVRIPGDTLAGAGERVMFDGFQLTYARTFAVEADHLQFSWDPPGPATFQLTGFSSPEVQVLDISSPGTPVLLGDVEVVAEGSTNTARFSDDVLMPATYVALTPAAWRVPAQIVADAPSSLRDPTHGADYLIVTHETFAPAAEQLAAYRAAQGLRAQVAVLEDVYDDFGYGERTPETIRTFLRYAYQHWQPPAPTYVLLMGDGNYDPKDFLGLSSANYLPPYLAYVDPWMRETAADNRFVSVVGDDAWPDMILGRLPVSSLAQAEAAVDRTIAYEQASTTSGWNRRLMFVTDNPDDAGDFRAISDAVIDASVPSPYQTERYYLGQTCATGSECKTQIATDLNSDGALFINFIGHGEKQFWAGEKIMDLAGVKLMTNTENWPIVLPMTCLEGYFVLYGGYYSLGEYFVLGWSAGGAVASWSPTGMGVAAGHDYLNRGFYEAVFEHDLRTLGEATLLGKLRLYERGTSREQIEEYTLFGDPALRIQALDPELHLEKTVEPVGQVDPGDVLTYTLSFRNDGPVTAHHVTLTDLLDPLLISPTVVLTTPEVISAQPGVTYTWDLADLEPGDSGQIVVRGVVSPTTGPTAIVNEAVLDSPASRDVVSVTTGVLAPDLYVVKEGPDQPVAWGETITYTISWGNAGRTAAPNTTLSDTFPPGVTYVSDTSGWAHSTPTPGTAVWQVAPNPVPTDTHGSFVVTALVQRDPAATRPLINRVRIQSDFEDGNPLDNAWDEATGLLYLTYGPVMYRR